MAKARSKTAEAPKVEAPKVAKKKLVLRKTIHIPNVASGNDDRDHFVQGGTYGPGTVVTRAMVRAYDNARKRVGGETPIEAFCE